MNRTTAMKMVVDNNQRFATSTRSIVLSVYTLTNHGPVTPHLLLFSQAKQLQSLLRNRSSLSWVRVRRTTAVAMDLLRNLGSAAVSSLVQKSGLNLPFSLGEKVAFYDGRSIWSLYDATKRV